MRFDSIESPPAAISQRDEMATTRAMRIGDGDDADRGRAFRDFALPRKNATIGVKLL
jgi:hypothetical protein